VQGLGNGRVSVQPFVTSIVATFQPISAAGARAQQQLAAARATALPDIDRYLQALEPQLRVASCCEPMHEAQHIYLSSNQTVT